MEDVVGLVALVAILAGFAYWKRAAIKAKWDAITGNDE